MDSQAVFGDNGAWKGALKPLNLADPEEMPVYKLPDAQMTIRFELPFAGKLNPNNRWVRLAHIIPWDELEEISRYRKNFGKAGNPALPFRVAFGVYCRLGVCRTDVQI
jgi:hypothetical protein